MLVAASGLNFTLSFDTGMSKSSKKKQTWRYREHELQQVEWGLWQSLDEPGRFLLCYRPEGRSGPVIRRWARTSAEFSLAELQSHVRQIHADLARQKAFGCSPRNELPHGVIDAQEALEEYITGLRRQNLVERYLRDLEPAVKRFLEHDKIKTLGDIDTRTVEQFLEHLVAEGVSARTQNKYRAHLFAWMRWAVQRDLVPTNPVEKIPRATEVRKMPIFPMPEQMPGFVEASPSRHDGAIWTFLALSGLRRGSFLALGPDCFRDDGILIPHTKRRQEWFLNYDDGCPLWGADLSRLGGQIWAERPPTEKTLQRRLELTCKGYGTRFTLHSFRHAFCSWLALMGEDREDISAWLHHSDPKTSLRWYTHLRPRGQVRIEKNRSDVFAMRSQLLAHVFGDSS